MNHRCNVMITFFFTLLLTVTSASAAPTAQPVTMTIPQGTMEELIRRTLPLHFPVQSSTLVGSVSIDAIKALRLEKDKLSAHITLSGHQLNIVTTIAGHNLKMKIGSLTMGFQCDATVRFDGHKQMLYIKPVISELQSTDKQKTEAASALLLLFNNREFPVSLDRVKPYTTEAGGKLLTLSSRIASIRIQPQSFILSINPQIKAAKKVVPAPPQQ